MKNIKIIGKTYYLRPLIIDDISEKYIGWLNNIEVNSFLEVRNVTQTYHSVKTYVKSFYDASNKYLWGIYTRNNKHIGTVNIVIDEGQTAEIGLMVGDRKYWGKGASDESIGLVLDFAFDTMNLQKASGGCYATNIGMVFTFKKLGFTRDKTLKIDSCLLSEKYSEIYRWSILSKDWKGKK